MPAKVLLTIAAGPNAGQQFAFTERTAALIGRAKECHIRFPKDQSHQSVSRHHCLLNINPPEICVRDLGSLRGTRVNGGLIGMRAKMQSAAEGAKLQFDDFILKDGDQIQLGHVTLKVNVVQPIVCDQCGREIAEGDKDAGVHRCEACRRQPDPYATVDYKPATGKCPRCGNTMVHDREAGKPTDRPCSICLADPEVVARRLLEKAQAGTQDLLALRGYRLTKELGRGGMGAVYLIEHERSGQRAALKLMLPQAAAKRHSRDLFLREVSNMKGLQHRHVVQMFDFGCSEGTFFFTQEYCERGSVGDLVKKVGKLPVGKAVALTRQALRGLEYAHQVPIRSAPLADGSFAPARGLVHRDIKPHNIFLAKSGEKHIAKIGDYGLAKAFDLVGLSGLSMMGDTMGTPAFMPRQQLIDYRNARPEVDVWAMAATLYYMLTLHYPRDFPKGRDRWQVVLQTDAAPIRQRDASIPSELAEVIDAALNEKPSIHFKSAAALRQALDQAVKKGK